MDWTREGKLYFPAENSNFYFLSGFERGSEGFDESENGVKDEKDEIITSSESELGKRIVLKTLTSTLFH